MNVTELQNFYLETFTDNEQMLQWNCENCDQLYHTIANFVPLWSQLKRALIDYTQDFEGICHGQPVTCHECLSFLCMNCVYNQVADSVSSRRECVQCPLCDTKVKIEYLLAIVDDALHIELTDQVYNEFITIRNEHTSSLAAPLLSRLSYVVVFARIHSSSVQQYVNIIQTMLMGVPVFNIIRPQSVEVNQCGICTQNTMLYKLQCNHQVCCDCFNEWMQRSPNASCPFCRFNVLKGFCGLPQEND